MHLCNICFNNSNTIYFIIRRIGISYLIKKFCLFVPKSYGNSMSNGRNKNNGSIYILKRNFFVECFTDPSGFFIRDNTSCTSIYNF